MNPRFVHIKFNLLKAIELFGDMNHADMDVVAPPSSESYFKEYQLANKLNDVLSRLVADGFFDDCDLRDNESSSSSSVDDEEDDEDDELDDEEDDYNGADDEDADRSNTVGSPNSESSRRRYQASFDAPRNGLYHNYNDGNDADDDNDTNYYDDDDNNQDNDSRRSTPRSQGFEYGQRSDSDRSSPSRQAPDASGSRSQSASSRESFSRRFKRWLGATGSRRGRRGSR